MTVWFQRMISFINAQAFITADLLIEEIAAAAKLHP
jgi:hypothetical protein